MGIVRLESSFIQIDGIGNVTERRLWEHGITHWNAAVDARVLRRDQRAAVGEHARLASDALATGDVSFFANRLPSRESWRLSETFRDGCVALDIETTGLNRFRDDVTTVSVFDGSRTETLVRGRDLTRASLERLLADVDVVVTYNGQQFDLPFLETAFDLDIEVPHVDLRYPCRRLGLTGGLKAVERQLGIDRELPDVDGRQAVELWYRYRAGDRSALERLVRYNQEDVRTLLPVLDRVHAHLEREVFTPYIPPEEG